MEQTATITTTQLSQLQQSLDGIGSQSPFLPYFAEYLPPPSWEAEIDMKKHAGLAFYYVVRNGDSQQRVATVWRSREFYLRDGERLRMALQAPAVLSHGFVARFAMPFKPFWRRMRVHTIVLSVAAFFGALQALGNYFDWIFAAPSLSMKWNESRVHLTEGSEFIETMDLVNDLPIAHRNVELTGTLSAADSAASPAVQLGVLPASVAHIGGSTRHEITISGVAPRHGKYEMVINVSARGGWVRDTGNFPFTQPVTVWPKNPIGMLRVGSVQDQTALLRGDLIIGPAAPNGLDCELEFQRISGLKYEGVFEFRNLHKSAQWNSNESPANEVAVLQWVVLPVGEHTLIPFQVAIQRDGAVDWNQIAKRGAVRCYYRPEKVK